MSSSSKLRPTHFVRGGGILEGFSL